jgi:hypothetical protein
MIRHTSGGLAAFLRIRFRCWLLAARCRFPSRPFPLSPRSGEPPAVRRVRWGEPLPLVAAGPVLAPPRTRNAPLDLRGAGAIRGPLDVALVFTLMH